MYNLMSVVEKKENIRSRIDLQTKNTLLQLFPKTMNSVVTYFLLTFSVSLKH